MTDIYVEDRCGLNPTPVRDMSLVTSEGSIKSLFVAAKASGQQISLAGMRHSHGGHTSLAHAWMAITETHNRILSINKLSFPWMGDPSVQYSITVQAGAVWSQLHHALNEVGYAPLVHQSSPHFTVGGSISVNCHGRDYRWGAVGNTVIRMKVLTGNGDIVEASRDQNENPDLFAAVIGGYGSCGMILEAELAVTTNLGMQAIPFGIGSFSDWLDKLLGKKSQGEIGINTYQKKLIELSEGKHPETQMHIGWLRFTDNYFFEGAAGYDYKEELNSHPGCNVSLPDEDYGLSEILRAGWHAAQRDDSIRKMTWEMLPNQDQNQNTTPRRSRLAFMRQAISFTAYKGEQDADILLEYFIPVSKFSEFIVRCKDHYLNSANSSHVHISTGSVRLLNRPDDVSNLSYSRDLVVSIALDLHIQLSDPITKEPTTSTQVWVNELTKMAISLGGSFYLPYYRFDKDNRLFQQAYNLTAQAHQGYAKQVLAIEKYNSQKVFWNSFLEATFQ